MSLPAQDFRIRQLDTRTDMPAVADLIEVCFGSQLDPDSNSYLTYIRRAAVDHRLVHWSYAAGEMISYPLNGFVCEKDGQVIGNLSIIPFYWKRNWYYLIANVAVHPDFRRQGIARSLTASALEHLRHLPIHSVWLHVREDNLAARHLYEGFQFQNRCLRDTWVSTIATNDLYQPLPDVRIDTTRREDWSSQSEWLASLYPPEVLWNLGFEANQYKPGILSGLHQLLTDEKPQRWSVRINGEFAGAGILKVCNAYADHVYLAWPADGDEKAITTLLPYIKITHSPMRTLMVNFPSHIAENAFLKSGFELVSRLYWMEIKIN